jgi:hypothetical protein
VRFELPAPPGGGPLTLAVRGSSERPGLPTGMDPATESTEVFVRLDGIPVGSLVLPPDGAEAVVEMELPAPAEGSTLSLDLEVRESGLCLYGDDAVSLTVGSERQRR